MQSGPSARISRILKAVVRRGSTAAARVPMLQRPLFAIYSRLVPSGPWMRTHPFDRQFGTDTSGFLPTWLLRSGLSANRHGVRYAGCHPTCVRAALDIIPDPAGYSFLDLGCGKGRAMIVASEYSFRQIIGVELSAELARVANRNAKVIRAAFPRRVPIKARNGDATRADLPAGSLVVFNYHAFGRELVDRIVSRLHDEVVAVGREVFFIYENPVHADALDSLPGFTRWFARNVPCDPAERGFSADDDDNVVVWRGGGPARQVHDGAGVSIVVTDSGMRAEFPAGP